MKLQTMATPWLLSCPAPQDKLRLFCLPYAGGGASIYREWAKFLPADVGVYPIQLPGRENRITEPPLYAMSELIAAVSQAIVPYLERPFVFFGHSMGARMAFELARQLRRKWNIQPCRLIVAGSRAPHLTEPKPLHQLPDAEFVQELRRFSGTPETILQNRELMDLFMPVLRADFTVDETYVYSADAPLACPISAFGGTEDREASREELEAWADHTCGAFAVELVRGNHFFLQTGRELLLRAVSQLLLQHLPVTGG